MGIFRRKDNGEGRRVNANGRVISSGAATSRRRDEGAPLSVTTRVRGGEYTRSKIQGTPEYRDAVEQKVAEIRAGAPDNRVYPSNPWYNPPFDGDELRSDLIAEVICEDALAIVHGAARE